MTFLQLSSSSRMTLHRVGDRVLRMGTNLELEKGQLTGMPDGGIE